MESIIIGIAGGSGSGKTTVVNRIVEKLTEKEISVISQDQYYRDNSDIAVSERQLLNFDHPDAIEFELLAQHLRQIKAGHSINEPTYDYISSTRGAETITIQPRHVVIVEGILLFTDPQVRELCNIKVYVDADSDDRLMRIIRRDMIERGRTVDEILNRYEVVKEMHDMFIEPTKKFTDIIVPQGGDNLIAIDILVSMIREKVKGR